jgi:hypothetical protein
MYLKELRSNKPIIKKSKTLLIQIREPLPSWHKDDYWFLNRVESEENSTISGNEGNIKAKNKEGTF